MSTYSIGKVTVTYNGADISKYFQDAVWYMPEPLPAQEFTITLDFWQGWTVRPRVASRQSRLWRHSFDWRNRKRGHPLHRA